MFPNQLPWLLLLRTHDHVYHPDPLRIWYGLTDGDRLGCQQVRQPMACSPASMKQRCGLLLLVRTPVYVNKQKLFIGNPKFINLLFMNS